MEAWRGHYPFRPFKRGQWRQRCLFIIGVGAGKFLGVRRIFLKYPQTRPKSFCAIFAHKFSPTKIMKMFSGVTSKKSLNVFFCKPLVPFFEVKERWLLFLPGFSGILPRFSANQNFWRCACPHLQHHCFS